MEFRFLGNSGLKVSAISYGNWVTHGAQVEADQATACVRAALEAGITTFDTRGHICRRSRRDDSGRFPSGRASREP
jgi:predicted oxidoreductase